MQRKIGLKMRNDSEQTISRSTLAVSLPSDLENNRKCIFKMFGWHDHHVPSFIPKNARFKWQSDNYQVYFLQSCKNDLQTAIINVFNQSPNILRRTIGIYEVFLCLIKCSQIDGCHEFQNRVDSSWIVPKLIRYSLKRKERRVRERSIRGAIYPVYKRILTATEREVRQIGSTQIDASLVFLSLTPLRTSCTATMYDWWSVLSKWAWA